MSTYIRLPDNAEHAQAFEMGQVEADGLTAVDDHFVAEKNAGPAEKALLRKLDCVIIPLAMLLYLCAYLDRSNIGSARLLGLQSTLLSNSDSAYATALGCFYATYILLSVPGTLLARAWDPSKCIATGAFIWSIAATLQSIVTTPAQLYACRAFVGVGEAMFGQSMMLYFSIWYRKPEIAKRIGLFIACGACAGVLGGLLAYFVADYAENNTEPWRILFVVEGSPSLLLALIVARYLPSRPESTPYLTEGERNLACTRFSNGRDGIEARKGSGIDWDAAVYALKDWKTYVPAIMYAGMNMGLSSLSGFLPLIVRNLGYTDAQAQLHTVPPYLVSIVVMLALTAYSDRKQSRGIPCACVFLVGATGWSILRCADASPTVSIVIMRVRYFACILVVCAAYCCIPLIVSWQASNCPSETQRAVALGMLNMLGQSLSILSGYLFTVREAPQFTTGTSANIAAQIIAAGIALSLTAFYAKENRRREAQVACGMESKQDTDYDRTLSFRYTT